MPRGPTCAFVAVSLLVVSSVTAASGAEPESPPVVRVVWTEMGAVDPAATHVMAVEAVGIFRRFGIALAIARADPEAVTGGDVIRVVLLASRAPRTGEGAVLGSTSRSGARGPVWIHYARVVRLAGTGSEVFASSYERSRTLGLTLGRVLVHELVHVLAPDLPHTDGGLMAPRHRSAALLSPVLIDDVTRRAALLGAQRRGPADGSRPAMAPEAGE